MLHMSDSSFIMIYFISLFHHISSIAVVSPTEFSKISRYRNASSILTTCVRVLSYSIVNLGLGDRLVIGRRLICDILKNPDYVRIS